MKLISSQVVLPLLVLLCTFFASNGEVVPLDDESFEHQTQASTGMTTGSWLIVFKAARCPHCAKLQPEFERLSEDEDMLERGMVLGEVNIMESPNTANRFMIRGSPTLLFLHKKRLYKYSGQRDFESLKNFVMGGFEGVEGEEIPTPPSALEFYLKTAKAIGLELKDAAMGKAGMVGYAILMIVGMLLTIVVAIIRLFLPSKKSKMS